MTSRASLRLALAAVAVAAACTPPDAGRPDFVAQDYLRLVAAEDARPAGGRDLETLLAGTRAATPALRAAAVRGLGRLERPEMVDRIAPLLADPEASVRREAANALAQSVHRGDGEAALRYLLRAADAEADPSVRGAVARSLGRLRLATDGGREVAGTLVRLSRHGADDAPPYQMEGVVLGMLSRASASPGDLPPAFRDRLAELTRYGRNAPAGDQGAVRVRAAAVTAFASAGASADDLAAFLEDPAAPVRRAAAARLGSVEDGATRLTLAARALSDPSPQVRLEAVRRGLASPSPTSEACALLVAAADTDPDPHVRLAALDALAVPCPDRGAQVERLAAWARALADGGPAWHPGAHALAALAAVAPGAAGPLLAEAARHPSPFARAWVARAAGTTGAEALLGDLSTDAHPNVRAEALRGLAALKGRTADPLLVAALAASDDNQLLLTVAELLEGSPDPGVAPAALEALARVSAPRMETLRDARLALLARVGAAGDPSWVPRLEPFLRDYDPAVALEASRILQVWTGQRWIDAPRGSPSLPLPTLDEMASMEAEVLVFRMEGGGAFRVRLLPWQGATNAVRLYRMARDGTLNGLTFHRVVPNFVIQGGSPGANEYAGHGAYTRDEVGLLPNWRGTVGLSTRGRDTGDGQIYVNLVDNLRLDHDYTVFATVVSGMEVVDAILEGDVITRVEVEPGS